MADQSEVDRILSQYGQVRSNLFSGEDAYFKANPNVTGMAADDNKVILNPYANAAVNKDAVRRNESFRLFLRDQQMTPDFALTPEQRNAFKGTPYDGNDAALRETIAARIYSGDPSALATPEQEAWVRQTRAGYADGGEVDRILSQYGPDPQTLGGQPVRPNLPDVTPRELQAQPRGQLGALHEALSSFGQPTLDALRRGYAGESTAPEIARTFLETGPMGPFGAVRTPPRVPNPIRAYHGSPHDFDEFRMDRVGTGEGNQAYGHGLYFAENPSVGEVYKQNKDLAIRLSEAVRANPLYESLSRGDQSWVREAMTHFGQGGPRSLRSVLERFLNDPGYAGKFRDPQALLALADDVDLTHPLGRMYEVNLHARPEQFLDWDRPLAGQSEQVRQAVDPLLQRMRPPPEDLRVVFERGPIPAAERHGGHVRPDEYLVNLEARNRGSVPGYGASRDEAYSNALANFAPGHGGGLYEALARLNDGSPAQMWGRGSQPTSHALAEAGIPGIRYLDQGSRNTGQGTSNYVVFSPEIIEILRKYGIAGPVAGATTADILSQYGPQENADGQ